MTVIHPNRLWACAAALVVAGCVSYSPTQLSAMNTVDLCELQQMQGPNLSPETKGTMQGELSRRGESCSCADRSPEPSWSARSTHTPRHRLPAPAREV